MNPSKLPETKQQPSKRGTEDDAPKLRLDVDLVRVLKVKSHVKTGPSGCKMTGSMTGTTP